MINAKAQIKLMRINLRKILALVCLILLLSTTTFTLPASASDTANGAEIFSVHCAGCHINGSNIIRRGKNLKKPALKKYNMDSIEAITAIVTNGKSNMSAYKDRLTEQQIQDVAAYVLEQAAKDWR
ncbi:cytochrome c class I [Anabaenopsis circularis NIES-21]|uniref:Cytochrome c class I n=1 Tax=Anabaenopsis circularis NIES-21 TaxID=1085406 RepID=A0A1Z4GH11_9CYAN|nr:cytochrome c class I [Anabaenopsis circularis NIES-21]